MRFRDLGVLTISTPDGDRVPGGRRPAALLAALLVELNQPVPTARLIETVWGARPPHRPAAVLESHIWRLRRVLEPDRPARSRSQILVTDAGGYRLVAAADDVDSRRLGSLVAGIRTDLGAGRPRVALDRAEDGVALWRGRPYADLGDGWIDPVRERLEELWFSLRELRVAALLDAGRPEQALAELDPLIGEQPYRERLRVQRMLALYRSGRQEAALEAYRDARALLRAELGIEPGAELRETERLVLTHDPRLAGPAPAPVVASPLPVRLSTFVGRESELAELGRLLAGHRLVEIVGAMGCGKTRIALEAADAARTRFADGVWFVPLAAVESDSAEAVAGAIVSTLRLAALPAGVAVDTLAAFARERHMLLVLDNCEHLLDPVAEVVETLVGVAPALTVLTTSREPLGVDGGHTLKIGPWPPPTCGTAAIATHPAAVLFADRVRSFDPSFALTDATAPVVARICAVVDGIPLGIELAAARLRAFSLEETADLLAERPADLARSGRGPLRHRTLADSVEWSHRLLEPDEQTLHRRLSVFGGAFTAAAARGVCGAPPLSPDLVPDLLVSLVRRSLLMPIPPAQVRLSRFVQLVPVRAHAVAALAAAGEAAEVTAARNAWTASLVAARPRIGRPEQDGWYDALEADHAQVRAFLLTTLAAGAGPAAHALGVGAVARLAAFWHNRSLAVEGLGLLAAADAVRAAATPFEQAMLDAAHGTALGLNQRMEQARPYADAALAALRDVGPAQSAEAGHALAELASAVWVGDDHELALHLARRAITVGDDPDVVLAGRAVAAASEILLRRPGGADEARSVLADATAAGSSFAAFFASMALGVEALFAGDPAAGLRLSRPTMQHYLAMGGRNLGDLLEQQANHHATAGQFVEAARCYGAAAASDRRAGLPWPRHPHTAALHALTRDTLAPETFDRAWARGEAEPK